MITQADVDKAVTDFYNKKINYNQYLEIWRRFDTEQNALQTSARPETPRTYTTPQTSTRYETPRVQSITPQVSYGMQDNRQTHDSSRRGRVRNNVIEVSPPNYDGSIHACEQPNHGADHVKNYWELQVGKEYIVMRTDEKGTRQIGNVIITGKPKEKPFSAKFYPVTDGSDKTEIDPEYNFTIKIDPVRYGLMPNRKRLWSADLWLERLDRRNYHKSF